MPPKRASKRRSSVVVKRSNRVRRLSMSFEPSPIDKSALPATPTPAPPAALVMAMAAPPTTPGGSRTSVFEQCGWQLDDESDDAVVIRATATLWQVGFSGEESPREVVPHDWQRALDVAKATELMRTLLQSHCGSGVRDSGAVYDSEDDNGDGDGGGGGGGSGGADTLGVVRGGGGRRRRRRAQDG